MDGYINCDVYPGPTVDLIFDCQKPWPFKDNSASNIYCSHTLEHLQDHVAFFKHAWRILRPMGEILIRVPHGNSSAAMADMTHLRPWFPTSFASLQPGYHEVARGNHYNDDSFPYWVIDSLVVIPGWLAKLCRYPFGMRLAWWMVAHIFDIAGELWVILQKTSNSSPSVGRNAGYVPVSLGCWKSSMEGERLGAGSMDVMIRISSATKLEGWA